MAKPIVNPKAPVKGKPVGGKVPPKGKGKGKDKGKGTGKSKVLPPTAKNLANPGLRALIPLGKLPLEYRKRRLANRPIVEGSTRRVGDLQREAEASAKAEFADSESTLGERLRENLSTQGNIGNWFGNYRAQLDQAKAGEAQQLAQTQGEMATRTAASQQAADAERSRMDTEARQSAASRGAEYSGDPGRQAAQAQESRRGLQDAFQNLLSGQSGARQSYLTERQGVGHVAQISAGVKNAKARDELRRLQTTLGEKKGAAKTKYIADEREKERKSILENAVFKTETNQKAAELTEKQRKARADERDRRSKEAFDRKVDTHGMSIADQRIALDKYKATHKGGGGEKFTDEQRRKNVENFRKGYSIVKGWGDEQRKSYSVEQLARILNTGREMVKDPKYPDDTSKDKPGDKYGINSDIALALADMFKNYGKLSPGSVRILDRYKIPFDRSRIKKPLHSGKK